MRNYLWLCHFFVTFVTFINVKLYNLPCNLWKFHHYVILITLSNVLFYTLKPGTCVVRNGHHCVALRWLTEIRGEVLGPGSGLVPYTFLPVASTSTYIAMHVSVITNGACLSSVGVKMYASLITNFSSMTIEVLTHWWCANYESCGIL